MEEVANLKFMVALVGTFTVRDEAGAGVTDAGAIMDEHLDAVMEELLHLGAEDPRIDLDLGLNSVEFHVTIKTSEPIGALSQASGLLRTAIHSAGGGTPDWPLPPGPAWAVKLVSVRSDPVAPFDSVDDQASLVSV